MRIRQTQAAEVGLVVLCAAALAWAPLAQARSGCDRACRAARQAHREHLKELRQRNALQKRPNVVLIDTDDMNQSDMFVMRNTLALLSAHGTTFANSYVSYPLCCPSRATHLTGQYAHNDGVTSDALPNAYAGPAPKDGTPRAS